MITPVTKNQVINISILNKIYIMSKTGNNNKIRYCCD